MVKVEVKYDQRVQKDDVNANQKEEGVEIAMVVDAHTGIEPVAMVVKSVYTLVADVAVL
jgi:hypothetical protein